MNQRTLYSGYWYTILVWAIGILLCLELSARAESKRGATVWNRGRKVQSTVNGSQIDRSLPRSRHYAAREMRQECSVFATVATRMKTRLSEKERLLKELKAGMLERRAALDRCAQAHGILENLGDEDEVYLAEACAEEYDEWLNPGPGIEVVREDVRELRQHIEYATAHLKEQCPKFLADL